MVQAGLLEQTELERAPSRLPGVAMVSASASVAARLSAPDRLAKEREDAPPLVALLPEVAQVLVLSVVAVVVRALVLVERVLKLVLPGQGPLEEVQNRPADT